jgi:hypothetical protein
MLHRFVAGSSIASVGIACAAFAASVIPSLTWQRAYPLAVMWCFAPLAWGIWAVLAPAAWVPQRLPAWGALLGLIAGVLAAFVFNLPVRVLGQTVPAMLRGAGVAVIVAFYFVLWMLVRAVYGALSPADSATPPKSHTAAA